MITNAANGGNYTILRDEIYNDNIRFFNKVKTNATTLRDWIDSKVLTSDNKGTNYKYDSVNLNWNSTPGQTWAYILNRKPFAYMYCEYVNHWGGWNDYIANCKSTLKTWYSSYGSLHTEFYHDSTYNNVYVNWYVYINSSGTFNTGGLTFDYTKDFEYYETGYYDDWDGFLQWETHVTLNVRISESFSSAIRKEWQTQQSINNILISEMEKKLAACDERHGKETNIANWITNVKSNNTIHENIMARADISAIELNQALTTNNSSILSSYCPNNWEKLIILANNKITNNITNYRKIIATKYPDSEIS